MEESAVKAENGTAKAGYKSWKKKYRKMRINFDKKMQDGENLHKQEAKACATAKRIAVENEYVNHDTQSIAVVDIHLLTHLPYSQLLELLFEINNSPQIPLDKRIDVSMAPALKSSAPVHPIDRDHSKQKEDALKRLEQLISEVPHSTYATAKDNNASFVNDLSAPDGEAFPTNFLTVDDMDNYIHAVDGALDGETRIPTLAPAAHPDHNSAPAQPHLTNPTSVTNWLRKHAPKIFLQDGEQNGDGEDGEGSARKPRGGRSERGGKGGAKGKRASAASRLAQDNGDVSMDDDADYGTPTTKGKRKRDEDPGYKPSRPSKKKRKSESDGPARKSKKDSTPAAKEE